MVAQIYYTAFFPCSISTFACNRVLRCTCMQQNNICLHAVLQTIASSSINNSFC